MSFSFPQSTQILSGVHRNYEKPVQDESIVLKFFGFFIPSFYQQDIICSFAWTESGVRQTSGSCLNNLVIAGNTDREDHYQYFNFKWPDTVIQDVVHFHGSLTSDSLASKSAC